MGTALCLAFFLTAMTGSGLWLRRVERQALRPVFTTAALAIACGAYVAFLFAL